MNKIIRIKCPLCDETDILVKYTPEIKRDNLTNTVGGRRTKVFSLTKEKYEVLNSCSKCHSSKETIEKALKSGRDYNQPSHKSVLDRMRKAGLPTKI